MEIFSSLKKKQHKALFCPLPSYPLLDTNLQHCGIESSSTLLVSMRQES